MLAHYFIMVYLDKDKKPHMKTFEPYSALVDFVISEEIKNYKIYYSNLQEITDYEYSLIW